jgi:hypothetical protein
VVLYVLMYFFIYFLFLFFFVFFVYRLVSPFCTEVLYWPADSFIFVCKHLDDTVDLSIYT